MLFFASSGSLVFGCLTLVRGKSYVECQKKTMHVIKPNLDLSSRSDLSCWTCPRGISRRYLSLNETRALQATLIED